MYGASHTHTTYTSAVNKPHWDSCQQLFNYSNKLPRFIQRLNFDSKRNQLPQFWSRRFLFAR